MDRPADSGLGESHGCYLDEKLDSEWKSFHKTLESFPHSFQLQDQQQLSISTCRRVLSTLQVDLDAGLPTPLETARALNLLGYLHFQLGRPREALERTEQALQQKGEERNVASLGNMAAILWLNGDRLKAREQVTALEKLRNDDEFGYLVVKARAELAFSYTRLGGHFATRAIPIFTKVIAEAQEPELWLWKFGLALTERRVVHMNCAPVLPAEGEDARLLNVLRTLLEVTEKSRSQNLKAKAYSEVAHLLQGRRGNKSQKTFEQEAQLDPVRACYKALELDPNDSSVLWKCGRIFRYAKLLDQSCELLEKSVEQRPTTTEYHHLGLSYKALATRKKYSRQDDCGGGGRGESKRGRPRGRWNGFNERGGGARGRDDCWGTAKEHGGGPCQRGGRGSGERWQVAAGHEGRPDRRGRGGRRSYGNVRGRGTGWYERGNSLADSVSTGDGRYFQSGCRYDHSNDGSRRGQGIAQFNTGSYSRLCHLNQYEDLAGRSSGEAWSELGACGGSESRVLEPGVTETSRRWKSDQEGDSGYMTETELSSDLAHLSLDEDSSPTDTRRSAPDNWRSPTDTLGSPSDTWVSPDVTHRPESSENFSGASPAKEPGSESEETSPKVYERTPSREGTQRDIRSLQCIVKSPSRDATRFSRSDPFVQEAMDAFQKAVDLSEGENIRAVYDLALMHRALDELEEALKLLDTIQLARYKSMGLFDKINAYEQAGLILKDMSERTSDEERRRRLNEQGESKLNMALYLCSSLCSRLPGLQYFIRKVWHSFPILLQAARNSDRRATDKLREQARLYQLIKDNWQSMALLQEIQSIEPEQAEDPEYLKMCIEDHVSLEHYDKASAFLKTLKCTAQGSVTDLFEDDQYVQKIYVQAGRAALLKATAADAPNDAGLYFSAAFSDTHSTDSGGTSSSEDADSGEEGDKEDSWDIMLLHEDSAKDKAIALSTVLEKACGLKVTRMDEECLPGRPSLESVMWVMSRSRQVVVLAGSPHVKGRLRLLLDKAARKPSTVVLLVEGDHVPKVMKSTTQRRCGSRSMVCPEELLGQSDGGGGGGLYPQTKVQAVCDVFSFLIDIPSVSP